jgi:hypothetical protein
VANKPSIEQVFDAFVVFHCGTGGSELHRPQNHGKLFFFATILLTLPQL